MARLSITLPDSTPTVHELTEELNTIGRAPENSIRLDDVSVSARHAEIALVADNFHLKDLGSTNGTMVNGQPVTDVRLRAGDRIRFGKVEVFFEGNAVSGVQPLPRLEEVESHPAELSTRPADFANASPFPSRKKVKDPVHTAILAAVALSVVAFLVSLIALFVLRPPAL